MNISHDSITAIGALSSEHVDTLHVHWTLLSSCNYHCSYCYQPRVEENCVFVRERIMAMAHSLLESPRPRYIFTFTGGEPTLHPHLPEVLSYLQNSGRTVYAKIETNGSRDITYFKELLRDVQDYTLQFQISVHLAHAELSHILILTAAIAEAQQLAHVRLMFDPEQREAAYSFHEALTRLRGVVPFTANIEPVMQPSALSKPDPRLTEVDFAWMQEAEAKFASASTTGPVAYPALPFAVSQISCEQSGALQTQEDNRERPFTQLKDFYCCLGTTLVRVDADGCFYGALCNMVPNNPPLWRAKPNAIADAATITRCRNEHCCGGLHAVLPKFRTEEAAQAHMDAMKERAMVHAWEAAPLRNPLNPEPTTEQVVRARLKRMKLLRETVTRIDPATTAIITFGDVLEEAVKHYASQEPPLQHMPSFVLVDWDGSPHEAWEKTARNHAVTIVPMKNRDALEQKIFCLYARPNTRYWESGCLQPLVRYCSARGLDSGYQIDALTTSVLWKRSPNRTYVRKRMNDICKVYTSLADEESRDVFLRAIKTIEMGDAGYLPISKYAQYAHPLVKAESGEVIFEGGLASGATTKSFAQQVGAHGHVVGFEPLQKGFIQSQNTTSLCSNVHLEHLGLWSSASTFYIEDQGGGSRMVSSPNERTEECHSIDLDTYAVQNRMPCSLIKLDIEGAEMECLKGAKRTIRRFMPKLQISLYHHVDHYLDIPLWLLENFPDYKFHLGHHGCWLFETCLYALPPATPYRRPAPLPAHIHTPLVSIIVPTHNNEDTLKRCIDSALIQGVDDMEIIIVDDASTDKTPEIIAEYVRRFPKMVRTMRFGENKGAGPARNAGMDMAMGKFMAFIDSDDMLAENFLKRGLEVMEQEGADIVGFDMVLNFHNRKQEELWNVEPGTWAGEESLRQLLLKNAGGYGTYSRLYRSAMLAECNVRYSETRVHQDMFFSVRAFFYSQKTVILPDVGYYRYVRKGSNSANVKGDTYLHSFVDFVSFLTRFFADHNLDTESEMYTYCIKRVYHWDRDRVFAAITQAEKENRLLDLLTEERLLALGESKEALCCILADYATLHCHRNNLHPKVAPKDLDWRAAAAAPRPPKTYTAYGHAENPTTPVPLLSVIVPNYNKENYLKKCFDSIFSQSMQDFEVIIIDDASTDSSYDMLMDYADMNKSVRLYKMDYNNMQGTCRNMGIEFSRGKYITFIDSDDFAERTFFEYSTSLIERKNVDMIAFSKQDIDDDGNALNVYPCKPLQASGVSACRAYWSSYMPWGPWAKIFNADFIKSNKIIFSEGVYHQDVFFMSNAMLTSKAVMTDNTVVYNVVLSKKSSIRPATKNYTHICSIIEQFQLRERVFSSYFTKLEQKNCIWDIENFFLPSIGGFYSNSNEIAISNDYLCKLSRNSFYMWSLLLGYARCRAKGSIQQGILPSFTQRLTNEYTNAASDAPLVSVIIPTYNQEACISRCLDSVLTQSLRNIEVIVINDASTDKTLDLCEAYAKKDPRVRVYSNERNRGQGYSRNWALEMSRGEYITYVDSDDYVLPDFLLRGSCALECDQHMDIVYFAYSRVDSNGNIKYTTKHESRKYNGNELFFARLQRNFPGEAAWASIYRSSVLKDNMILFPDHFYEDACFNLSVARHIKNALFLNEQAYNVTSTTHENSTVTPRNLTKKHLEGNIKFYCFLQKIYSENAIQDELYSYIQKRQSWAGKFIWPYIASFDGKQISSLTDENIADLSAASSFLRVILDDYAKLYALHTNFTPALSAEDLDPLWEKPKPADYLIPLSSTKECITPVVLSVIIPAYNVAPYLARCLDSVLEQDVDGVEIILVEDCSNKDNTLDICKEYAAKHESIRLFQTPWNSGLGAVRNLAMQQAQGEYFTFVDSDDWVDSFFLMNTLEMIRKNKFDVCSYSVSSIWDNYRATYRKPNHVVNGIMACMDYVEGKYSHWAVWGRVFRSAFLKQFSLQFNHYFYEDVVFLINCFLRANQVNYSDIMSYNYYRNNRSSIMNNTSVNYLRFKSQIVNLQYVISLFNLESDISLSEKLLNGYCSWIFNDFSRFKPDVLYYIHSCNVLGLPSPLTDEVLETLTLSKEFMRNLIMDYAVLSQKPLPEKKGK